MKIDQGFNKVVNFRGWIMMLLNLGKFVFSNDELVYSKGGCQGVDTRFASCEKVLKFKKNLETPFFLNSLGNS
jgi:hypothetical protein